jgi:gliding motility-associated lipoprotein GldD
MKYYRLIPSVVLLSFLVFSACKQKSTPKPRGYFRIDFPETAYQLSTLDYPYQFEYPTYARLKPDSTRLAEPFWLNIEIDQFNAKIHLSYKPVSHNLYQLTEESRNLAYKHTIKAIAINEKIFINDESGVYGTIYEIKGNTASPFQFHLTDSLNHFIRGSFYISEIPNYDSLRPVINFIDKDIHHFIETFSWK